MMSKLYKKAVKKAKEDMSCELFLGFYKVGQITAKDFDDLEDAQIHYSAILEMKEDKSWGDCEKAYSIGIDNIATDILGVVNSWKISIKDIKVGSIIYTKEISKMSRGDWHHGHKWEVLETQTFNKSLSSSRSFFIVEEKDYNSVCIGKHQPGEYEIRTFFTCDELEEFGYDDSDKLEAEIKHFDETDPERIKELAQYKDMFSALENI